jgi:hypothetical protein
MMFEEFQHLARLSVVGALDAQEQMQFEAGRRAFGLKAERFLKECRKLNAVFALSLSPCAPDPRTKARLFAKIRAAENAGLREEVPGLVAFSMGGAGRS